MWPDFSWFFLSTRRLVFSCCVPNLRGTDQNVNHIRCIRTWAVLKGSFHPSDLLSHWQFSTGHWWSSLAVRTIGILGWTAKDLFLKEIQCFGAELWVSQPDRWLLFVLVSINELGIFHETYFHDIVRIMDNHFLHGWPLFITVPCLTMGMMTIVPDCYLMIDYCIPITVATVVFVWIIIVPRSSVLLCFGMVWASWPFGFGSFWGRFP